MGNSVTLGGDRLGAGGKQKVQMHGYERSTHDLDYTWRSSMASGTLVPFLTEVGLPGDSFDINLECDVKTLPTIGPLFGSYKVQIDVFSVPIRLYNGKLHMNMLGIGMEMDKIKLPQVMLEANSGGIGEEQINPSSIWSYLNIRGLGKGGTNEGYVFREFNAIPYLAYWDIYKNYYANKQEEEGVVIHNNQNNNYLEPLRVYLTGQSVSDVVLENYDNENLGQILKLGANGTAVIEFDDPYETDPRDIILVMKTATGMVNRGKLTDVFNVIVWEEMVAMYVWGFRASQPRDVWANQPIEWLGYEIQRESVTSVPPKLKRFSLENIDKMRMDILAATNVSTPFVVTALSREPYGLSLMAGELGYSKQSSQEGLGIKTYQSDLFNNWVSTEWIDGESGINSLTAIDTSEGSFNIDTLMLSRKVYDMFNRIAVSGGSYDDWLNAVYDHNRTRSVESPVYMGGLIKELAFQEVVSNAETMIDGNVQPLGSLAGKGVMTNKNKGGKINIKIDEPSYIMGIVSLTPRVDYSQGNKWDVNLKTMDDFHKPALDEIGFQDLITDQMAWFDTKIDDIGGITYKSAGKVPAWINYMTNVNQTRGNFAVQGKEMFMTLNRKYEEGGNGIKDLTTYIDPSKYNNIFADERLDAQNFWTQIGVDMKVRRKMSSKVMPNL